MYTKKYFEEQRMFVDALREFLGLNPLYSENKDRYGLLKFKRTKIYPDWNPFWG